MTYIFLNKVVYICLLSLSLDLQNPYLQDFLPLQIILIAINIYHLILIRAKKLGSWNLIVERLISICRMMMLFLVGVGAGGWLVVFSPVASSFWMPLLNSTWLSGYFLFYFLTCMIFLGLEFYNFYLLRINQFTLRARLEKKIA